MKKNKKFISKQHNSTKRLYLDRMNNSKIDCMKIAKAFSQKYWDGDRKFGYGGYYLIPGYWKKMALNIIKNYKLNNNSTILDIGCGKGFLLYEIKKILPNIKLTGIDISKYAIKNSPIEIKKHLIYCDARKKLPFKKKEFDFVYSFNCLHNFKINELIIALKEIVRISNKSYLVVESYRNEKELFNLQCWALTCQSFFSKDEWLWLFKKFNYNRDYEFIYFR